MDRRTFNPDQIRQLEANLHVASVSDRTIQYKGESKIHAVRDNSVSLWEERDYANYLLLKRVHDRHKGRIGYRGLYMEMFDA